MIFTLVQKISKDKLLTKKNHSPNETNLARLNTTVFKIV